MKNYTGLLLFFLLTLTLDCFGQEASSAGTRNEIIRNGVNLGSVIAVVISWSRNRSVLFTIIHGIFSWLYVIYYVIMREVSDDS